MENLASKMSWSRIFVNCTLILMMGILLIGYCYTPKQTTEPILQPMFDKSKLKHQSKHAEKIVKERSSKGYQNQSQKAETIVKERSSKGYKNQSKKAETIVKERSSKGYKNQSKKAETIVKERSSKGYKNQSQKAEKIVKERYSKEKDGFFLAMKTKQDERIQHFRQKCESFGYNKKTLSGEMLTFRSRNYKLAWKSVPKIGSTFLIQVFQILDDITTEDVFRKSRMSIHNTAKKLNKRVFKLQTMHNYTVLIMARNPYSRLFSGYIDKVYLPNALELPREIYSRKAKKTGSMTETDVCKFNNTFDDFLNYAFDENIKHLLNGHYGPVLSKQKWHKICRLPHIVIVKQESFSDDVEYALRLIGVEKSKFDTIYAAMHEKNAQSNIPGIVKTVYQKMSVRHITSKFSKNCLSWPNIAERVWKSFQVQGYLNDKSEFPHHKFSKDTWYRDSNYLIDLILSEIKKHPLTHEQKVKQRTKALLNEYSKVSKNTKLKIQQNFALDFSFFDYSKDLLPSL